MKSTYVHRIAGLDTLRALAITAVMVYHLNWMLPPVIEPVARFGWMGVDLFFVLSGYLIGCQLFKPIRQGRQISILTFYRNRAYRILPAYLTVLALYLVWPLWHEADGFSPLWQFLTFTENLFVDYSRNQSFSHVWSLCIEEHFYLLLPLAVLLLSRKPNIWKTSALLVALVAVGIGSRAWELAHVLRPLGVDSDTYVVRYIERIYYPTYSRLDGLLAGVTLALIRLFRPQWSAAIGRHIFRVCFAGLALVGIAIYLFNDRFTSDTGAAAAGTLIGFPILSIGLALVTAAAAERRSWIGRINVPGSTVISTIAYSLYLTHKEVGHLCRHFFPREIEARDWHSVLLLGSTTLATGAILYYFVERPMLDLRSRRHHNPAPASIEARTDPAV